MSEPFLAAGLARLAALAASAALAAAPGTRAASRPAAEDAPIVLADRDVSPILADGPLSRATADLEAGRSAAAAPVLATGSAPEPRFLAAIAFLQAGDHAAALPLLTGLEQKLPDLADRVHFRRGQALDAADDRREAAAAYGRVAADSLFWAEARLSQARALDAAGDGPAALAALRPLLAPDERGPVGGPAVPEALLLAGRIRARGGEAAKARRAYLDAWSRFPLSPAANDSLAALRALPGDHGAAPAVADVVHRAEALLDQNRNAAAAREIEKALPRIGDAAAGAPLACRARFALGKAYRKERQHTKAAGELAPVVAHCSDHDLRVKALYLLASAESIAAPPDGLRRYRQLAAEYPDHPFADDALFYAADLLARDGRADEARAALVALAGRYPRGDFQAEALFRAAWLASRAGDRAAALAGLATLEERFADEPYEHARAAYWRARLLASSDAPADQRRAEALWTTLVERYPADWYGLLARTRLAERGRPEAAWPRALLDARATPTIAFSYREGALRADRHFRAGVLLLRLGQARAAADELAAVNRRLVDAGGPDGADPLLLVAELLDRAGDHQRAHHLVRSGARSVLRGTPDASTLRVWRIAYPAAFREEIERWAPPAGVEPDLLQALMREESALDPRIVSAAGAVGLTQLMVPTAQDVAKKLKLRRPTAQDLMDGPLNIRIGAAHLGDLLKRFEGSMPLAVASYNVGGGAVRRWLRERGELPLDEFVEEIPVQETRGYVKRVLRSYAAYRLLYGGGTIPPAPLAQALPRLD